MIFYVRCLVRRDGIEIHCDEKRGWISLACEPDAFKDFHDYVRSQLRDLPEIDLNQIDTIEVTNTAHSAAKRELPSRRAIDVAIFLVLVLVPVSSIVGFGQIIKMIIRWVST